jgi:hypothetical protein
VGYAKARMTEELEELCGKISLTEGEKIGIKVNEKEVLEARAIAGKCLVGKVWTDKSINREAFMSLLSTIWRIAGDVKFKDLKNNMWLFEFSDQADKRRVMEGRPWSFDRQILVLNEFDGSTPPSQLAFDHSPFWIQAHDMPLICMNKEVGTKMGKSLGELIEVDVAGDGMGWGSYLRLRVNIDLTKPLDRGRALNLAGKTSWVEFKYEKLPLFCFRCGRVVHGSRGCPIPSKTRLNAAEEPKAWGPWLRAVDQRRSGNRGGAGFREEESRSRNREEEAENGAQSNDRSPQKGKPENQGNPTRQQDARPPAGSTGSGTYHVGENHDSSGRREISVMMVCEGKEASRVDPRRSSSQTKMGRPNGLEEDVHGGPITEDECSVVKETCLDEDMHEITSMAISLAGVAEPTAGAENATVKSSKPNLKTWKRMARRPLENGLANRILKRRKRAPGDLEEVEASQTMKKLKNVDGTRQFVGEILAEAVEQPRQQP